MLSVKKRQTYLKELGFYNGKIDGKVGPKTKQAYKDLQTKFFTRKQDIDSSYGTNTDKLLQNVYNCRNLKHIKVTDLKCQCKTDCTHYPYVFNTTLLKYLDDLYEEYQFTISSAMRCKKRNKVVGGVTNSRHTKGKAVDIICKNKKDLAGRKEVINYYISNYKNARYGYCNGYGRTKSKKSSPSSKTMGNAIHLDI